MKAIVNNEIVELTAEILAEQFAEMDSKGQAQFYNHLAHVASKWHAPFPFQLQAITDEDGLNMSGRRVMDSIGDYSHWGLI